MDINKHKILDVKGSLGTCSKFNQNDTASEDDPISAYFKQRCESSKVYFEKHVDADLDSSIGPIDVDNLSLFDEGEEDEIKSFRLSEQNFDQINLNSANLRNKQSEAPSVAVTEVKSEIDKQRALAQEALRSLSNRTNDVCTLTPTKRDSMALTDISSKLMNMKLSNSEKGWFQPNFSPNTPRYFNDELDSFGVDENIPVEVEISVNEESKIRQSTYAEKVNSVLKKHTQGSINCDMKFERQTKEEQINRFEEDEKKFKLDNCGVLHNSQISQFSGIVGEEVAQWESETSTENKNLSIGQFFNLRSHRVSSLIGSTDVKSESNSEHQTAASALGNAQAQTASKSECSFSIKEMPNSVKPKVRRCVSTHDLKQPPEVPKSVRCSSDSRSSNSTLMIQEILAEMESGLSGAEIYDKLMKSYGRILKEGRKCKIPERSKRTSETKETPKSSKVPKRKDLAKSNEEAALDEACKESKSRADQNPSLCCRAVRVNETSPTSRNDNLRKPGPNEGFYSSTPKNQDGKSESIKFRKNCGKVIMGSEDWEPPRVNSIKSIEMNRSECSEEIEKTILVNSNNCAENRKNAILVPDTFTIEDTIVAGDLTVISQRIEEMKRDSVCIVRSAETEEPVLLTIIQKLADFPSGSLDCSALTPLLRDQFPELLSTFPTPSEDSSASFNPRTNVKVQDALIALPGSWVKLPSVWGLKEKIYACADLEKTIFIPFINVSQQWLLASIEFVELLHPQGKKLPGDRKEMEWWVKDFVVISLKETIIPPDNRQSLKVSFKSKIATKVELILTFRIKELIHGEVQTRILRLLVNSIHPENYINVLPNDPINFGVIADQCFDHTVVQVTFDGICELPLTVYIEEGDALPGHFALKPCTDRPHEKGWDDSIYHHVFWEGEKQILEFRIVFRPNILLKEDSKTQEFRASLVLMLGSKTDSDGILRKIPMKGAVGFAKFLCKPSCSPLVFKVSQKDKSVTRSYPLRNVGSLPIAFSFEIMDEDRKVVEVEDAFVVPKSFYLSRNEEAEIPVTFNPLPKCQNFTKRYLSMQVKPNGQIIYEVELIGIIATSERKPSSRTSGVSVSTKSTANSESVPVKLLTTTQSLGWAAVALEREARQTFQIKSVSTVTTTVRINFERNLDAFKMVNDNGEKVQKLRKVLKPDTPCALTVVFRPDVVGAHNAFLTFQTSHSCRKEKILLNGIGGIPNLLMKNVKSDLNGCKILSLQHSRASNQLEGSLVFTNEGRIPAFLVIKSAINDFSLTYDLTVTPSSVVVHPDSSVSVTISQKLKNDDLQQLLCDRDIRKIASVCVLTGDEPSRLRIRKLVESGRLQPSDRLRLFTASFCNEKEMNLKNFKDPPGFENDFLKSLKVHEVAVVVERNAEIFEPSILEETAHEFISFVSNNTVMSRVKSQKQSKGPQTSTASNAVDINATVFATESPKSTPENRVTKWLETLDCV